MMPYRSPARKQYSPQPLPDCLKEKIPKSVYLKSFVSGNEGVTVAVIATGYDDVAQLIVNLKTISVIDDVYVSSVQTQRASDIGGSGTDEFSFTLTCVYTNPNPPAEEAPSDEVVAE